MVLSLEVRDPLFADEFLSYNNDITELMSSIAHECSSGMENVRLEIRKCGVTDGYCSLDIEFVCLL